MPYVASLSVFALNNSALVGSVAAGESVQNPSDGQAPGQPGAVSAEIPGTAVYNRGTATTAGFYNTPRLHGAFTVTLINASMAFKMGPEIQ